MGPGWTIAQKGEPSSGSRREAFVKAASQKSSVSSEKALDKRSGEVPLSPGPEGTAVDTAQLLQLIYENALKVEGNKRRAALKEMERKGELRHAKTHGQRRRQHGLRT